MNTMPSDLDTDRIAQIFSSYGNRYDWTSAAKVGTGGFGAVWRVRDSWLGHDVAIKISNQSLVDEVLMCREIDGRAVRVYDYLKGVSGWNAFSMELLNGHWMTLQNFIGKRSYKNDDLQHYFDCFEVVRDLLEGLNDIHGHAYARIKRFVHADIKPQNLMVGIYPKKSKYSVFRMARIGSLVKIIDLGVATGKGLYPAGITPDYSFPNAGPARAGHDLYSLAVVFVQMLTGILPSHYEMANGRRIGKAISRRGSGSRFIDQAAAEFARRCARAATQAITSKALLGHLNDKLFSLDAPHLIGLRSVARRTNVALKKTELSGLIFPDLAPHFGWRNKNKRRLSILNDLIDDLYSRDMLVREGHKYHTR